MNPSNRLSTNKTISAKVQSFAEYCRQSWRGIAIGAAFVFFLSVGSLLYALFAPKASSVLQDAIGIDHTDEIIGDYRLLDGVSVSSTEEIALLPLAVMVENSYEAWPLSGVADANIVFEAPVEGSITRFMLVFDPTTTSTKIGPVRSARPYYVDLAEALGGLYGHVGGSPEALAQIKASDRIWNVDEFYYGVTGFWRSEDRYAPHNTYTSIELLNGIVEKKEFTPMGFTPWIFSDESPEFARVYTEDISVPYLGAYRAHWSYNQETRLYTRYQNGIAQRDSNSSIVKANTVVLLLTDSEVIDDYGRLHIRTTGSDKALLFRDGTVQEGYWRREEGGYLRFETIEGQDLFFARGKAWVSIMTSEDAFDEILVAPDSDVLIED